MSPVANNNIVCNIMFRSPRGATRRNSSRMVSCMFQSTFPRGERRLEILIAEKNRKFQSTLPRGERQGAGVREQRGDHVSIHAPAWGATTPAPSSEPPKAVSIHAPAWGATSANSTSASIIACFNPRSRVGSDVHAVAMMEGYVVVSIHAPAWGATPIRNIAALYPRGFNPRSRVGSDIFSCCVSYV